MVGVHLQQPLRQELTRHGPPLAVRQVLAHAEHGELVVAPLRDLGRGLAPQDVHHVPDTEPLVALAVEPQHRGQELLGGDRAVPGLGRVLAGVARAAGARMFLAEVAQQLRAAALDRLAEGQHRVEVGRQPAPVRQVALGLGDHLALLHDVGQAVGEPRRRRQAVAPGTARLLVVALDGLGQVEVRHEPHVGLVDAHAERDGRDHDHAVLPQEGGLVGRAHLGGQARVVRQGADALLGELLRGPLDRRARQAVHDPGVALVLGAQQVQQLLERAVLGGHPVGDVGPVEARHEVPRLDQAQALRDLLAGVLGGRRGQRDARHPGPAFGQRAEAQVVGPEVVPPLGHAVRLVDGEQRDRALVEQPRRRLDAEPLRGQVQQVQLARAVGLLHLAALVGVLRGVEEPGAHPERLQGVDLVLHQGDQRGDDHARAPAHQRGDLVAQRLAAARRHQHQGVAAARHRLDDVLLVAAERVVAEHVAQHVERRRRQIERGRAPVELGRGGVRVSHGGQCASRHRHPRRPRLPGGRVASRRAPAAPAAPAPACPRWRSG